MVRFKSGFFLGIGGGAEFIVEAINSDFFSGTAGWVLADRFRFVSSDFFLGMRGGKLPPLLKVSNWGFFLDASSGGGGGGGVLFL